MFFYMLWVALAGLYASTSCVSSVMLCLMPWAKSPCDSEAHILGRMCIGMFYLVGYYVGHNKFIYWRGFVCACIPLTG
jgi:hypothetical protein